MKNNNFVFLNTYKDASLFLPYRLFLDVSTEQASVQVRSILQAARSLACSAPSTV